MTFQDLMEAFHVNPDLCNETIYRALLEQMKRDRVTPVVGAGLSCWAGYPLWKSLLFQKAHDTPKEKKSQRAFG